ncbi:hypothetical protein P7K49_000114, partial [Saguinus oedipus]
MGCGRTLQTGPHPGPGHFSVLGGGAGQPCSHKHSHVKPTHHPDGVHVTAEPPRPDFTTRPPVPQKPSGAAGWDWPAHPPEGASGPTRILHATWHRLLL